MERIVPAAWTDDDRALWARIAAHDFEVAGAALTFAGRLARDHGWSLGAARAAFDAYRRVCFLAVRPGAEVTPSEEVDEVWHQHLVYSRDYWQVWCREVLRRQLHHGPTLGGPAEGSRFAAQYADTLAVYEAWFGPPSADLWPGTAQRFGRSRFRIVDGAAHIVIPIPRGALAGLRRLAGALSVGALLSLVWVRPAAAAALNVLDWTAGPFLALYVALACASLAGALLVSSLLDQDDPRPNSRSRLTPAELGFLAGGSARAADVLILEKIASGDIALRVREGGFGPFLRRTVVLSAHGRDVDRAWPISQRETKIVDLRRDLVEDGLVLPEAYRRSVRCAAVAVVSPVMLLGLAKLAVGIGRGKPVGILLFLLVSTAAALALSASRSRVSRAGRSLVKSYKAEHARALRAPRPEEMFAAFAVAGASALAGTAFEPYSDLMRSTDGGGCGGGGGGCGGCGGGD